MSVAKILKDLGYVVIEGRDAVLDAIRDAGEGNDGAPLCSGYGVLPNGDKCLGCLDCNREG